MTEMCCKTVYSGSGGFGVHRCGNAAKVQRNSLWYCVTHDPVKVAQRKAKRQAEWDDKNKADRKLWRLHSAAQAMHDALEAVIVRGCGCYAVTDENYHSDKCPIPQVIAALAKARGEAR